MEKSGALAGGPFQWVWPAFKSYRKPIFLATLPRSAVTEGISPKSIDNNGEKSVKNETSV